MTVQASMTPQARHQMHEVIGRDVQIAPPKSNGDQWLEKDPAALALLAQIEEACRARDEAMAEYLKAKPIADRASATMMRRFNDTRRANDRALKLREVLAALKGVPGA